MNSLLFVHDWIPRFSWHWSSFLPQFLVFLLALLLALLLAPLLALLVALGKEKILSVRGVVLASVSFPLWSYTQLNPYNWA